MAPSARTVAAALDEAEQCDESLLVSLARQGDGLAFDQLMRRRRARTFNLACYLLNDVGLAEEITVETFAEAYRSLDSFKERSSFETWICGITVNLCMAERRRRRRRSLHEDQSALLDHLALDEASPADQVSAKLQAELIRRALQRLDARQRTAIALFYIEHRSYKEVAAMMGVPVGTAKSDVRRGVRILGRMLGPQLEFLYAEGE